MLFKGNIDAGRIPEKLNQDGLWNEDEPWTGRESTSIHSDRKNGEKDRYRCWAAGSGKHSHLITSTFSESD